MRHANGMLSVTPVCSSLIEIEKEIAELKTELEEIQRQARQAFAVKAERSLLGLLSRRRRLSAGESVSVGPSPSAGGGCALELTLHFLRFLFIPACFTLTFRLIVVALWHVWPLV